MQTASALLSHNLGDRLQALKYRLLSGLVFYLIVSCHQCCLISQWSRSLEPKSLILEIFLSSYVSGAGLKADLVLDSIGTESVPKHIYVPVTF